MNRQVLTKLRRGHPEYAGIEVFIETGTFDAQSALQMAEFFSEVHTIELSEVLHKRARVKHQHSGIHFHQGDSAKVLPALLLDIRKPALFYLDAHWCEGEHVADGFPLWEELGQIAERPYADIVIVDDAGFFGRHPRDRSDLYAPWQGVSQQAIVHALGAERILAIDTWDGEDFLVAWLKPEA